MKINLFLILFFVTTYSFGQIKFEKGYFIEDNNTRVECLIKNNDWENNPIKFTYKLEDSDVTVNVGFSSIKEFCIYGESKFIKSNVKIDRSSSELKKLTRVADPIWTQETLFLKVLVEGKANLYYYKDGSLERFFYSVSDSAINQLIFKNHLLPDGITMSYNAKFRQQLGSYIQCGNTSFKSLRKINYKKEDLETYFTNYNLCMGDSTINVLNKPKKKIFYNLKITTGADLSSITIDNDITSKEIIFKNNLNFRFSFQSEFILPFNRNKWSIIIEPTFQYFNQSINSSYIKFNSIEFPLGVRHYFYINDRSKLFINGMLISHMSLYLNAKVKYDDYLLELKPQNSLAFGGGFEFDRLSFETRYYTSRELLRDYVYLHSEYTRFSFIIGYKIISNK